MPLTRGLTRLSKSNVVNPSAWTTCRGIGGTQAKAVGLPPASYRPARHGLLFHTDGHYVDPASSRKRAPAPTGLAEHAYTAVGPRVRLATCCTSSIQTVSVGLGKTRTSGTSASLTAYRTG
jgi:hypothetical protein